MTIRKIDSPHGEIFTCPNGCSESEIEIGTDESSFLAILGSPYLYIRCGECHFGEDNKEILKTEMKEAVQIWNESIAKLNQPTEAEI